MSRIEKQSIDFLKKVAKNNNREWFAANKESYDKAKANLDDFAQDVLDKLRRTDLISTPSGKRALYRIYRDVRFAKDKTPYNKHWSAYYRRDTALLRGGYYWRIESGNSGMAGGFWNPNSKDIFRIRKEIESDDNSLRKLLKTKKIKDNFGYLEGKQLKVAPKGFDKEHPAIDLLRYKQYLLRKSYTDAEVLAPDFADEIVSSFKALRPFFDYMSEVLCTDLNGVSLY